MPLSIPRSLVDFILLGPEGDRRQLQDSPLLGDVWAAFAHDPLGRLELLLTPHKDHAAGRVAWTIEERTGDADTRAAYLQGIVAARLTFPEVITVVVPRTYWWSQKRVRDAVTRYESLRLLRRDIGLLLDTAVKWQRTDMERPQPAQPIPLDFDPYLRYITLAGLILWATGERAVKDDRILGPITALEVASEIENAFAAMQTPSEDERACIWNVSLNRNATPSLTRSVPAVKGDAARRLFEVDCSRIIWAVIDSGIDANHSAFGGRVKRSFDFTKIREIVSLDNLRPAVADQRIAELLRPSLRKPVEAGVAKANLTELADGARKGRMIDWRLVEPLIEIQPETPPPTGHGTHVAGILGAKKPATAGEDAADGMCPDIQIYDFRVLAPTLQETEFAIIAALQFIRYLNERNGYPVIHGANLSLAIRHDVRNYACGQTPVCVECERLVNSGVVVVAAAGNRGYQNFETKDGLFENYAAFSITDPGNGDGVITVGATHRHSPHTYGVSFFSSRGPTGDGRMKPDLVAPGERIRSTLPEDDWGDLDGTSMAAPHVSGAAAMLLARYPELQGRPKRIKEILCASATDLGRERSFQGHGMLDVLRAFQSI